MSKHSLSLTYGERAGKHSNPAAKKLLEVMERKQTNLSVSVDVTTSKDFLAIIDAVGPYVCLIKTHVDILEDFNHSVIESLRALSLKHDFLIFEDRKFADIGNTVALQYSSGVHKIASWSHITNAHSVPGPSIVDGLASVGLALGRGLLLLAEMSTKGSLAVGEYTNATYKMARERRDFVIGFIGQSRPEGPTDEDFLVMTPGVGLDSKGDGKGQQYRTPEEVVLGSGCDIIIVGRGVYGKDYAQTEYAQTEAIAQQAKRYKDAGWGAYQKRLSVHSKPTIS